MTTNAQAIAALVQSKAALQAQCDGSSDQTLADLTTTIHNISSEIGALGKTALSDANYVPATTVFKSATDDAKSFLEKLRSLKQKFDAVGSVAKALDSIVNLITKHGL
jgi:DNA-binding ferritin-like protein